MRNASPALAQVISWGAAKFGHLGRPLPAGVRRSCPDEVAGIGPGTDFGLAAQVAALTAAPSLHEHRARRPVAVCASCMGRWQPLSHPCCPTHPRVVVRTRLVFGTSGCLWASAATLGLWQVASGWSHAVAVSVSGRVVAWGRGDMCQLGVLTHCCPLPPPPWLRSTLPVVCAMCT